MPEWDSAGPDRWDRIDEARDDEVWRAKEQGREQLVAFIRRRLRESALARGMSPSDVVWCDEVLDGKALTICFARRFASYKRATLLLSQPERLRAMLLAGDRPVQFVFAGKAHPADETGKEMIRQIVTFAADLGIRHRFVFLEDYDIAVARALYQGADVWLNNPRRPQEACGTSGMKAALNGGLNCSILDGWWDELFNGENGWAVSSAEQIDDPERRDEVEANSLFELLERQIVPLFYERWEGPVPRRWVRRIKSSLRSLGPGGHRGAHGARLRPGALRADRGPDRPAVERRLPSRRRSSRRGRPGSSRRGTASKCCRWRPTSTSPASGPIASSKPRCRSASSTPVDVEVQLLHGLVGQADELEQPTVVTMAAAVEGATGNRRYRGQFACEQAGRYGFTVRVVPAHPLLTSPVELGRIAWA